MNDEEIIGRSREDVAAALQALGIGKGAKPAGLFEKYSTKIPAIGEVAAFDLSDLSLIDKFPDMVRLNVGSPARDAMLLSWYDSMIVAEDLGFGLMSNCDYWRCLEWAYKNDTFLAGLMEKNFTWTRTLVYREEENPLISMVMDATKVTTDEELEGQYRMETKRITPTRGIIIPSERVPFDFSNLEQLTGIPFEHGSPSAPFSYTTEGGGDGLMALACYNKGLRVEADLREFRFSDILLCTRHEKSG